MPAVRPAGLPRADDFIGTVTTERSIEAGPLPKSLFVCLLGEGARVSRSFLS